jgi:hypothetical protein
MSVNDNPTSVTMQQVEIYTDGGCEPNPGPGGYGVVLLHPRKRAETSGGFRLTTNNCHRCFNHLVNFLCPTPVAHWHPCSSVFIRG